VLTAATAVPISQPEYANLSFFDLSAALEKLGLNRIPKVTKKAIALSRTVDCEILIILYNPHSPRRQAQK
jgi:hypothetical protein